MKFTLDLWPDLEDGEDGAQALLAYAVESIKRNPDLAWDIAEDDGTVIGTNVVLASEPEYPDLDDVPERLEYLRGEIQAERISQGEILELQGLAEHIDSDDVELLEWAGVPEDLDERAAFFAERQALEAEAMPGGTRVYNVRMAVVELVRASSEAEALMKVRTSLQRHGFEPYDDAAQGGLNVFESEPLDFEPEPLP